MSSVPPHAAPSATPEEPQSDAALAALVRLRGAPLLAALEHHLPGQRERAESAGSFAFAAAAALGLGRADAELCREAAKLGEVGRIYTKGDHHESGARLALGAGVPEHVCNWLLRVREHYDGSGPESLRGEAIPIVSRVAKAAAVCESALHALDTEWIAIDSDGRRDRALDALRQQADSALDPQVVTALAGVIERASGSAGSTT